MGMILKEEYLEMGLIYAREGNLKAAYKNLRTALLKYTGLENPQERVNEQVLERLPLELLSYYGLCAALVKNRVEEGITLCRKALAKEALRPDVYLNLGKVYLKANEKAKALKIFQRGIELGGRSRDFMNELKNLGIRKKRALSFLPRNHFVNRYAGRLLRGLRPPKRARSLRDQHTGYTWSSQAKEI